MFYFTSCNWRLCLGEVIHDLFAPRLCQKKRASPSQVISESPKPTSQIVGRNQK